MEIIKGIQSWIYVIIDLVLIIYCLIKVKYKGFGFLATAFCLTFISSLMWKMVDLLNLYEELRNFHAFYTVIDQFTFVTYIGFALFFILGISQIASSLDQKKESAIRATQVDAGAATRNFGNVGVLIALILVDIFLVGFGIFSVEAGEDSAIPILIIGIVLSIVADIYFIVLLYRIWKFAINESRRYNLVPSIDTPGKAVGFLFIPFFSLYWVFKAFGKLPKDLNAIAKVKGSSTTMSEGIGTSLAMMSILSIIPFVGYVTAIIWIVIAPVFISQSIELSKNLSLIVKTAG